MLGDTEMHHDTGILDRIFGGHWAGECLASQDPAFYQQNYKGKRSGDLTMIEVLQSESDSINGLFNDDTDQNQGHRNILLSDGAQAGGFSYQKTAGGGWVLNYNDSYDTFSGKILPPFLIRSAAQLTIINKSISRLQKLKIA